MEPTYEFETKDDGFTIIKVTKKPHGTDKGWLGEMHWPTEDLPSFLQALEDHLHPIPRPPARITPLPDPVVPTS